MLASRLQGKAGVLTTSSEAISADLLRQCPDLRMVANMRDIMGRDPGSRMLTIVGASLQGYYEAYLDQMHDVRLVDAGQVLN